MVKVENKIIVEATERELYKHWLKIEYDDVMSFPDFLKGCEKFGTKIIEEDNN